MANRYGVNVSLSDAECEEIARKVGEAPKKVYRRDVKPGQVFRYQKDHDKAQRILAIDSTWWMYNGRGRIASNPTQMYT